MTEAERIGNAMPEIEPSTLPQWAEWLWTGFGCDTSEIADILGIHPADAERALHEARYGAP